MMTSNCVDTFAMVGRKLSDIAFCEMPTMNDTINSFYVHCTVHCTVLFFLASVEKQIFIFCIKCKCENKKVYERIAPVSHMQIMDFFMTNSKKNEMKWHVQVSEEYDYLGRGRYCCSWSMRLQYTHCFRDFF